MAAHHRQNRRAVAGELVAATGGPDVNASGRRQPPTGSDGVRGPSEQSPPAPNSMSATMQTPLIRRLTTPSRRKPLREGTEQLLLQIVDP